VRLDGVGGLHQAPADYSELQVAGAIHARHSSSSSCSPAGQ
jgi:hypothetical protein